MRTLHNYYDVVSGYVAPTAPNPSPSPNPNPNQAALIKQYGIDGVTASVHSGFYAAAMSTVPTVEQMLNDKFGITRDENMERARMTCCAVHKAP